MPISYIPDKLPELETKWDGECFTFSVKEGSVKIQPYFINSSDKKEANLQEKCAAATFELVVEKSKTLHWGFKLRGLPQAVADDVDCVGFKLVESTFPFEVEVLSDVQQPTYIDGQPRNIVRWHVPALNISIGFDDLLSLGQLVEGGFGKDGELKADVKLYGVNGKTSLVIDPIVYSAPTITVTGYTSGTPCTYTDLYNASVAGGWGVVALQGVVQFLMSCKLIVGDWATNTYFADAGKHVVWANGVVSGNNETFVAITSNATFVSGELFNEAAKLTNNGCAFLFAEATYYSRGIIGQGTSVVYLYGSFFVSYITEVFVIGNRIWNCDFQGKVYPYNIFNLTVNLDSLVVGRTLRAMGTNATVNNIIMKPAGGTYCNVLWCQGGSSVFKNIAIPTIVGYLQYIRFDNLFANDNYFINVTKGSATFYWAGTNTGKAYWQYEFDLTVKETAENGGALLQDVTAVLKDKDGNTIFTLTTDATGKIVTQTINHGYYNAAGGDTEVLYSPFSLYLTKTGYMPQSVPLLINAKTELIASLRRQLSGTAVVGDVAAGATFYKDDSDAKLTGTLTLSGSAEEKDVMQSKTFYNDDLKTQRVGTYDYTAKIGIAKTNQATITKQHKIIIKKS